MKGNQIKRSFNAKYSYKLYILDTYNYNWNLKTEKNLEIIWRKLSIYYQRVHLFIFFLKIISLYKRIISDYLESAGDSKFMSLISRYQTLEETNQMLFDGLNGHADNVNTILF